jgi:hypothetical protein
MHFLFLILFFYTGNPVDHLDLKTDLKQDKQIIGNEPVSEVMLEKMNFRIFEKYARLNLIGYTFKSANISKHTIKSWISPNHKIKIYEVITRIHVDTVYHQHELRLDSLTKKYTMKDGEKRQIKGNFIFHTYVIKETNKEKLIYVREEHRGLCEYWIAKQHFLPVYEAIDIGFPDLNLKEILKLAYDS